MNSQTEPRLAQGNGQDHALAVLAIYYSEYMDQYRRYLSCKLHHANLLHLKHRNGKDQRARTAQAHKQTELRRLNVLARIIADRVAGISKRVLSREEWSKSSKDLIRQAIRFKEDRDDGQLEPEYVVEALGQVLIAGGYYNTSNEGNRLCQALDEIEELRGQFGDLDARGV